MARLPALGGSDCDRAGFAIEIVRAKSGEFAVTASGKQRASASIDEIISGIRRLAAGEWLHSPDEIVRLLGLANHQREQHREAQLAIQRLTMREREVLQALATGLDSKEIARLLGITISTERIHMMNILSKLGVHTRAQALVFAVRHGAVKIC